MYYANNYSKVHSSQDMTDNSNQLLLGFTLVMIGSTVEDLVEHFRKQI